MKKALAIICSAASIFCLASCNSCEYVSDTAKEASKIAHSEVDKGLESSVKWYVSTQESDGKSLVETGTVSYGCRSYLRLHAIHTGKTTIMTPMPYISCEHSDVGYRLVYDMSGNVIDFVRE